ncbi:MAG: HAD family hydrolase [Gammaproteobacteria bacterium]|nr:HAD family hydrolase [Gammaproteobacteria bacterium]
MALALFDLDNTLLGGDSDYLWGQFLVEQGIVDGDSYERENRRFYDQYKAGTLDIHAFLAFSLRPLAQHPPAQLYVWRDQFIARLIDPIVLPEARDLVERHRAAGDTPVIITATNRFVTAPIAARFGIEHLIATEVEMDGARYTGQSTGIPCFQNGKVHRLQQWLDAQQATLNGSWFYSDSHNDLPLLEQVAHPVAVDPDDTLAHHARARGWPVISLRQGWTGPAV